MVLVDAGKRFYTFALAAVVASLLLGCGGGGGGATGEDGGGGEGGNTATRESIFVVDPDGGVYPVNEILVSVIDGTTAEEVEALKALVAGEVFASFPETNSYFLRFPSLTLADLNTARLILEADSRVLFTTTNNVSTLTSRPPGDLDQFRQSTSSQPPTPTVAYELVKVFEAWDLIWEQNPPLSPVAVGIIDSGVDANHPEFRPVNIMGFLEDLGGLKMNGDFILSHGTEVAGIIGAANHLSLYPTTHYQFPQMNGILAGITDDFSLYSARLGGATLVGGAKLNEIRESIRNAIQEGDPKIVNMSFGIFQCGAPSFFLPEVINNPCRSVRNDEQFCVKEDEFPVWKREFEKIFNDHRDVLFVAAAGNCNIEAIWNLPGGAVEAPNLISVAATTTQDTVEWAWFSNGSKEQFLAVGDQNGIHIAAPGQNVYAPTIDKDAVPLELKDYGYFSGTSAAAPMVTGVAAMMKAINPELTPESIKAIITETASTPCNPKERNGCLLNAEAAVGVVLAAQRDLNLKVEDTVKVGIANASVLDVPNGTLLGVHDIGSQGVIVSGPVYAGGGWWWKVDFESGADGWVSDTYLNKVVARNVISRSIVLDLKTGEIFDDRNYLSGREGMQFSLGTAFGAADVRDDDSIHLQISFEGDQTIKLAQIHQPLEGFRLETFLSVSLVGFADGTQRTSYSVELSLETSAGLLTFSEGEAGCSGSPCLTGSASNINEDSLEITGISVTFDNIQIVDPDMTEFSLDRLSLMARAGDVFVPGIPRKITRMIDFGLINATWWDDFYGTRILFQHTSDAPRELQPSLIRKGDTFEIQVAFADGNLRLTQAEDLLENAFITIFVGGANEKQKDEQRKDLQYAATISLETMSGRVTLPSTIGRSSHYTDGSEGVLETASGFGINYEVSQKDISDPLDIMGISFVFDDIEFLEGGQSELYLQYLYEFIMDAAQFEIVTTSAGGGS